MRFPSQSCRPTPPLPLHLRHTPESHLESKILVTGSHMAFRFSFWLLPQPHQPESGHSAASGRPRQAEQGLLPDSPLLSICSAVTWLSESCLPLWQDLAHAEGRNKCEQNCHGHRKAAVPQLSPPALCLTATTFCMLGPCGIFDGFFLFRKF